MAQFHPLKIANITKETPHSVSITFEVPNDLSDEYLFKAGQYITLRTHLNGEEVRRDYSICTNPESRALKVVVKEVENGLFSVFANTTLKAGDLLDVASPKGKFVFEPKPDKKRTVFAFAAGSGITPVMGILKTLLEQEAESSAVLVYGNKTPEETIFYNELNELSNRYPNRFKLQFVFSRSHEDNALFGRIEKPIVNYVLNNLWDKTDIDAFYLCGPNEMIDHVQSVLKDKGYNDACIHFELFTPAAPPDSQPEAVGEGSTLVKIMVDDEETLFTMPRSKTILECALDNDIDAPYSCQGGICSSCIARLKSGAVIMRQNNILTDSEVEEGLILTCQSQPTTPEVSIDYDDV